MKTEMIKEKKIDIKALWKSFINPQAEELTQEEMIMKNSNISEQDKELLLKSLNDSEKLVKKMFTTSYITNFKVKEKVKKVQIKNIEQQQKEEETEQKEKEIE